MSKMVYKNLKFTKWPTKKSLTKRLKIVNEISRKWPTK